MLGEHGIVLCRYCCAANVQFCALGRNEPDVDFPPRNASCCVGLYCTNRFPVPAGLGAQGIGSWARTSSSPFVSLTSIKTKPYWRKIIWIDRKSTRLNSSHLGIS